MKNNPFYILNIPCNASRRQIMDAAEDMSLFTDSGLCQEAQNILLNPEKRLYAELCWFMEATPEQLSQLRLCISTDRPITEQLPGIAGLNSRIHNICICNQLQEDFYAQLLELDRHFGIIYKDELLLTINQCHEQAGTKPASGSMLSAAIHQKRQDLSKQLWAKVGQLSDYERQQLISRLVDQGLNCGAVTLDLIDAYRLEIQPRITEIMEQAKAIYKNTESKDLQGDSTRLCALTKRWSEIVTPVRKAGAFLFKKEQSEEELFNLLNGQLLFLLTVRHDHQSAKILIDGIMPCFAHDPAKQQSLYKFLLLISRRSSVQNNPVQLPKPVFTPQPLPKPNIPTYRTKAVPKRRKWIGAVIAMLICFFVLPFIDTNSGTSQRTNYTSSDSRYNFNYTPYDSQYNFNYYSYTTPRYTLPAYEFTMPDFQVTLPSDWTAPEETQKATTGAPPVEQFSDTAVAGQRYDVDIVTMEPVEFYYTTTGSDSAYLSDILFCCETFQHQQVWVLISFSNYKHYFDRDATEESIKSSGNIYHPVGIRGVAQTGSEILQKQGTTIYLKFITVTN